MNKCQCGGSGSFPAWVRGLPRIVICNCVRGEIIAQDLRKRWRWMPTPAALAKMTEPPLVDQTRKKGRT